MGYMHLHMWACEQAVYMLTTLLKIVQLLFLPLLKENYLASV